MAERKDKKSKDPKLNGEDYVNLERPRPKGVPRLFSFVEEGWVKKEKKAK